MPFKMELVLTNEEVSQIIDALQLLTTERFLDPIAGWQLEHFKLLYWKLLKMNNDAVTENARRSGVKVSI